MSEHTRSGSRLAFCDCETTGLDADTHEIWEVGLIVEEPIGAISLGGKAGHVESFSDERGVVWTWNEYRWLLPVDLGRADPYALKIGRFHERHPFGHQFTGDARQLITRDSEGVETVLADGAQPPQIITGPKELIEQVRFVALMPPELSEPRLFARDFARLTAGCSLVGAVPSFDEERLRRLLKANGACPEWHYQPIDVETLVVGYLIARLQYRELWSSGDVQSIGELMPPWDSDKLSELIGVKCPDDERHTALGDARWAKRLFDAVLDR